MKNVTFLVIAFLHGMTSQTDDLSQFPLATIDDNFFWAVDSVFGPTTSTIYFNSSHEIVTAISRQQYNVI